MPTVLYVVRHGAASHDGPDPGLTRTGEHQATRLGRRLADLGVTGLRHSPRRRAVETAGLLAAELRLPAVVDPDLDDRTPVPSPNRREDYPPSLHSWLAAVPPPHRVVVRAQAELRRPMKSRTFAGTIGSNAPTSPAAAPTV